MIFSHDKDEVKFWIDTDERNMVVQEEERVLMGEEIIMREREREISSKTVVVCGEMNGFQMKRRDIQGLKRLMVGT